MFEMSLYQWPENIGEGSIKIIASGQASFDYTVTVTPTDGSAKCKHIFYYYSLFSFYF